MKMEKKMYGKMGKTEERWGNGKESKKYQERKKKYKERNR